MTGAALARAVVKIPGQPMTAVVRLKDQYANALVDANEAQLFKVGCERCRWGSQCSDSSALTRDECLQLGQCVGGTVPYDEQNKQSYCERLGVCSIPVSDDGSDVVSEEECTALGRCTSPGTPQITYAACHELAGSKILWLAFSDVRCP